MLENENNFEIINTFFSLLRRELFTALSYMLSTMTCNTYRLFSYEYSAYKQKHTVLCQARMEYKVPNSLQTEIRQ
jgi:hypothetical protein